MRDRFVILVAAVAGGLVWLQGSGVAVVADGSMTRSLLFAPSRVEALGTFLILGLPAVILGAMAAGAVNPMAGAFVVGGALLFPALQGGSIEPWLRAHAGPRAWGLLALEAGLWALLVAVWMVAATWLGKWLRPRLVPAWWKSAGDPGDGEASPPPDLPQRSPQVCFLAMTGFVGVVLAATQAFAFSVHPRIFYPMAATFVMAVGWLIWRASLEAPLGLGTPAARGWAGLGQGIASCAISTGVGLSAALFLMRSAATAQVLWSLLIAFSLGGLWARLCLPGARSLGVLLSPLVAAVIGYGVAGAGYGSGDQVLEAYYSGALFGPALALPIGYASAGVAGAALGLGWAEVLARCEPAVSEGG